MALGVGKRAAAVLLALLGAGCSEPPPPPPPPPERIIGPPPKPKPPERETVTLRWKVPRPGPLVLDLDIKADPKARTAVLDLSFVGGKRSTLVAALDMDELVVVDHKPEGDELRVDAILASLVPGPIPAGAHLTDVDPKRVGQVKVHTTMTQSGLVSPNLPIDQRQVLASCLELPVNAVGVGDTWSSSLMPVWIDGRGWTETGHTHNNRATLTAIEHGAGQTTAVIDFVNEEHREGSFKTNKGKQQAATVFTAFRGHGRFLVEAGRWESLSVHQSVHTSGIGESAVEREMTLKPMAGLPEQYRKLFP